MTWKNLNESIETGIICGTMKAPGINRSWISGVFLLLSLTTGLYSGWLVTKLVLVTYVLDDCIELIKINHFIRSNKETPNHTVNILQ